MVLALMLPPNQGTLADEEVYLKYHREYCQVPIDVFIALSSILARVVLDVLCCLFRDRRTMCLSINLFWLYFLEGQELDPCYSLDHPGISWVHGLSIRGLKVLKFFINTLLSLVMQVL